MVLMFCTVICRLILSRVVALQKCRPESAVSNYGRQSASARIYLASQRSFWRLQFCAAMADHHCKAGGRSLFMTDNSSLTLAENLQAAEVPQKYGTIAGGSQTLSISILQAHNPTEDYNKPRIGFLSQCKRKMVLHLPWHLVI
jgi:hypothetical protein